MISFLFTTTAALAISLIHCEDSATKLNITTAEGEPCYGKLESMAEEHCSNVKKFLVGTPSVSWFQAKVNCETYGYKLASITSQEENDNIMQQLKLQGLDEPVVWTGFNDLSQEGKFVWASNVKQDSTYLNWYEGEPNNNNDDEDCVNLYPDGTFNDYNCYTNMQYVCEYYCCPTDSTENS